MKNAKFSKWFKQELKERGLRQREVAEQSGLNPLLISRLVNGEFPPPKLETIVALANVLEISPVSIFERLLGETVAKYRERSLVLQQHDTPNPAKLSIAFGGTVNPSRLEALYDLIRLVDGVVLERSGTTINFFDADEPDADTWRGDVRWIVAKYFQDEIRQYMPDGRWQLRVA